MEAKPRDFEIFDCARDLETRENVTQLLKMFPDHTTRVIILMEPSETLMTDRKNHHLP